MIIMNNRKIKTMDGKAPLHFIFGFIIGSVAGLISYFFNIQLIAMLFITSVIMLSIEEIFHRMFKKQSIFTKSKIRANSMTSLSFAIISSIIGTFYANILITIINKI